MPYARGCCRIETSPAVTVAEILENTIGVGSQLVSPRQLECKPCAVVLDVLVVDSLSAVRVEHSGDEFIHRLPACRAEEPQLIAHNATPLAALECIDMIDFVAALQSTCDKIRRHVVALP